MFLLIHQPFLFIFFCYQVFKVRSYFSNVGAGITLVLGSRIHAIDDTGAMVVDSSNLIAGYY
jgi:hypothetical protein